MSKLISIVVPCYNEAEVLPLLYERLRDLQEPSGCHLEFILVDDGSTDSTWEQISSFAKQLSGWQAIRLSRNFGHQRALWAGLKAASGDAVFVIDADLQDPPELLEKFCDKWKDDNKVVYGVRQKRKEGWLKRIAYKSFYRLLSRISDIKIPLDSGDFCLMDRVVVNRLLELNEPSPFIRGARAWVGYRQVPLEYERSARAAGKEKYGLSQLLDLAFNGFFSYSRKPLRLLSWSGLWIVLSSLACVGMLTLNSLFVAGNLSNVGPLSLVGGLVGLVGGANLLGLGIVGEYLYQSFEVAKSRPPAIVEESVGQTVGSAMDHGKSYGLQETETLPIASFQPKSADQEDFRDQGGERKAA